LKHLLENKQKNQDDCLGESQVEDEILNVMDQYRNLLEEIVVSRCPFTGEEVSMAMDTLGLDGNYWNYDFPLRKIGHLPDTFFAFDGAMKLHLPLEKTPYICAPGPDLPFVLPRLLAYEQIKCVVSKVHIGDHEGYIMMYYASPKLLGVTRVNEWATNRYWDEASIMPSFLLPGNFYTYSEQANAYDYDLEYWIKKGKLLWISEKDPYFTLHSTVVNCPYLSLEGKRSPKYVYDGHITYYEGDTNSDENEAKDNETIEDDFKSGDLNYYMEIVKRINEIEGSED
jgi:hypothetical protein